jgi:DNA-binding response OmpR family regulator
MELLLIEPHAQMARALRRGLEEEGFAVDVAASRDEGDARARARPYAAVVIDLDPPANEGLALLRRWREAGLTTPALLVVVPNGRGTHAPAGQVGAVTLVKPFPITDLLARLRDLLPPSPAGG